MAKTLNYTAEEINKKLDEMASATDYSATLTTAWSGTAALFTQDVPISGIVSTDTPIVDIAVSTTAWEAQETEWSKIVKAESYDGGIKFYAREKTTTALQLIVKVVK